MPILYVARSPKLGRWASDVGLGKNIYKVGVADGDPKALAAAGWAGETDWTVVRKTAVEDLSEAETPDRPRRKEKKIDPDPFPKPRGGARGFSVTPPPVRNPTTVTPAPAAPRDPMQGKR